MKLFVVVAKLHSSIQRVGQSTELPEGIRRDSAETFGVRGGTVDYVIPAFDAATAEVKAKRRYHGLIEKIKVIQVYNLPARRWDEKRNRFIYPRAMPYDTVKSNNPQPRMQRVHDRLVVSVNPDFSRGWTAGKNSYSIKKKSAAINLRNAIKKDKPSDIDAYSAAFLRSWAFQASRPLPAPEMFAKVAKKTRKIKVAS